MKSQLLFALSACIATLCSCNSPVQPGRADFVLEHADIVYPDSICRDCNIAVIDGKIESIYPSSSDEKWVGKEYLNVRRQFVYPGFIDAHTHFMAYGLGKYKVDLTGTNSWEDVVRRTVQFAKDHPELTFIEGRGWDQNDWEDSSFPTNDSLNFHFPNIQVVLTRVDGHAVIVNDYALAQSNYIPGEEIEGGLVHAPNDKPTGVLIDNAINLLNLPPHSRAQQIEALLEAEKDCFKAGLTSVVEAGLPRESIELIDSLQQAGILKMQVYAMVSNSPEALDYYCERGPYKSDRLNVRSFKFYGDGALGSRGACLIHPYHDAPNERGFLLHDPEHFRSAAARLAKAGFQMNTHAIGDSANRLILDIYGEFCTPENDLRWRIEHAQVMDSSDFAYFNTYGIIPSVQPTHATSDMPWAENRLGPERIQYAYAYQRLLDEAGLIALGTDFPVEDISPIETFYAATIRKDGIGYPPEGFQMENAIGRVDALKGMTIWAAYACFEESEKGSIEAGKWADFTILDKNLLRIKSDKILSTKVLTTVVHGEVVYKMY
ncbi:MAG: amidohydrolase [Bacteroidetes bacterium]|nr:MAG: amidohydrolase [Bacteroidota bacterium]